MRRAKLVRARGELSGGRRVGRNLYIAFLLGLGSRF